LLMILLDPAQSELTFPELMAGFEERFKHPGSQKS